MQEEVEQLEIKFWGTRGSIPSPGKNTVKYGGNTTCVELILNDNTLVIFDAGTGIKNLGQKIIKNGNPKKMRIFFTHSHWDHIQGFPLFTPAYYDDMEIQIYACEPIANYLKDILTQQMDSRFFPVKFDELKAKIIFKKITKKNFQLNDATVSYIKNNHPGTAFGFKVMEADKKIVFITDNELYANGGNSVTHWYEFVDFCKDADLLIHDAHYLPDEMIETAGWGHSSYQQALNLGIEANVKHLIFFHHEPDRTDDQIESILKDYQTKLKKIKLPMKLDAAIEGSKYIV